MLYEHLPPYEQVMVLAEHPTHLGAIRTMSIATLDRTAIEKIVREIVLKNLGGGAATGGVPELVVSVSARHLHLTDEHVEVLFGPGAS